MASFFAVVFLLVFAAIMADGLMCAHTRKIDGFSPWLCFLYSFFMLALPIGAAVAYREYWVAFMVALFLKLLGGAAFFFKEGVSMVKKAQRQNKHVLNHQDERRRRIEALKHWLKH